MSIKRFDSVRSLSIKTFDKSARTVEAVMATETPVLVPDWGLGEMVDEVLLMSGCEIPEQVPLLDTHDDSSIEKQLGSTRSIRVENDVLVGVRHFDNSKESDKALDLIEGGHLTDGSIRYRYENPLYVEPRKSVEINGKKYQAGENYLRIATKWSLLEDSVCPIGADKNAKMRADFEREITKKRNKPDSSGENLQGDFEMNPKLKSLLFARGLAQGSTDEQALAFLQALSADEQRSLRIEAGLETAPNSNQHQDLEQVKRQATEDATRKAHEHFGNVSTLCRKFGIEDKMDELIKLEPEKVNSRVLQILEEVRKPVATGGSVTVQADEKDKFRSAAADAILSNNVHTFRKDKLAPGAEQMRNVTFSTLANECVRRAGKNPSFMTREEVIREARALSSSDFDYIMANVASKTMLAGFNYAPVTWRVWCRKGSNPDFKAASRTGISDAPEFVEVKEGGEITYGKMSDFGESVTLATYARKLKFTRKALIGDDMGVLNRVFAAFGARWAQHVNGLPYAVLSANANLNDTGALFNSTAVTTAGGHANLATLAGAPGAATLSAGRQAMRSQVAPEGTKLNITPSFLICGPSNEDNALLILTSESIPIADMSSGVKNIYRNSATPIIDANITGNEWYLAADPVMVDTVEVCFLDGNEAPSIIETPDTDILGMTYTAYGDATAKALGFRGLYKNAGQ